MCRDITFALTPNLPEKPKKTKNLTLESYHPSKCHTANFLLLPSCNRLQKINTPQTTTKKCVLNKTEELRRKQLTLYILDRPPHFSAQFYSEHLYKK